MIFQQLEAAGRDADDRALLRKITPSLVTLLAAEAEVQYVALRNISLIVERHPGLLSHDVKVRPPPITATSAGAIALCCSSMSCQIRAKYEGQLQQGFRGMSGGQSSGDNEE